MALTQGAKSPEAGRCSMSPGHMGQCSSGDTPHAELMAKGTKAPSSTPNNPFPRALELGEQSPHARGKFQGDSLSPAPLE